MPRGYVIMTEVIHDAEGMAAHGAVTYDSLVEHGAKMLVVDANYEVRGLGTWDESSRIAIMEFESPAVARHWYESEAGQKAHELRAAAADCNVIIASGFVPRQPGNLLPLDGESGSYERERVPEVAMSHSVISTALAALPERGAGDGLGSGPYGRPASCGCRRWSDRFSSERSARRQWPSPGNSPCPRGGSCRRGGSE